MNSYHLFVAVHLIAATTYTPVRPFHFILVLVIKTIFNGERGNRANIFDGVHREFPSLFKLLLVAGGVSCERLQF